MFTGLVAELGTVLSLTADAQTCRLAVRARPILPGLKLGDSVAVRQLAGQLVQRFPTSPEREKFEQGTFDE